MSSPMPAAAAPAADGNPSPAFVSYTVSAQAEPGVMPRVLELFAKRGLVPQKWHSAVSGSLLTIDVQMAGLDRDLADYIARCMRQVFGVETVLTSESRPIG